MVQAGGEVDPFASELKEDPATRVDEVLARYEQVKSAKLSFEERDGVYDLPRTDMLQTHVLLCDEVSVVGRAVCFSSFYAGATDAYLEGATRHSTTRSSACGTTSPAGRCT